MYVKNNLLPDEKVVYWSRPHWAIFANTMVILVIALMILIYGRSLLASNFRIYDLQLHEIMSLLIFIIALITGLGAFIRYQTSEYAITTKRILLKKGWIRRDILELFLPKVEAIHINQSILGRILNYGTLIVIGTGGTGDPFSLVPSPLNFRRIAQLEVNKAEGQ